MHLSYFIFMLRWLTSRTRTTGRLNSDQQLFSGAVSYRPLKLDLLALLRASGGYSNLGQLHEDKRGDMMGL